MSSHDTGAQPDGEKNVPPSLLSDVLYAPADVSKPAPDDAGDSGVPDANADAVGSDANDAGDDDVPKKDVDNEGGDANSGDATGKDGDGNQPDATTLEELIAAQELDADWVLSLKLPVKVDGKPAEATISELVKSYQIEQAAKHRLEQAEAKLTKTNRELASQTEQLQGQFVIAAKVVKEAETFLASEEAAVDWKKLREQDPAEFTTRKGEFDDNRARVEKMKTEGAESWEAANKAHQERLAERLHEHLVAENKVLLAAIPAWEDKKTAKAEKTELVGFLMDEVGFSEEEVMASTDHRLILLARDAMAHRKSQAKADVALKKVRKAPKTIKAGGDKPDGKKSEEPKDTAQILYG